jgi:hypothetical protein
MMEYHEISSDNVVNKTFRLIGHDKFSFEHFSEMDDMGIKFCKRAFDKAGVEYRNHYFNGSIVGRREYISNNVSTYQNMSSYKRFHDNVLELDFEFLIDNENVLDHNNLEDMTMIIRQNHIHPDQFNVRRKEIYLRDHVINSLYLYYTLFI